MLAGDTLRSAADTAAPMVAISLVHRRGYFRQHLDAVGQQTESDVPWSPETTLPSAQLIIEEVPVMIYCPRCQAPRSVPSIQQIYCVECETPSAEILQGRELQVVALELRS